MLGAAIPSTRNEHTAEMPTAQSTARSLHLVSGETAPSDAAVAEMALVRDRAAFDALENDWNDLFARSGRGTQLFQAFNWNWHWCNHYVDETRPGSPAIAVLTVRRGGRLVMLWPLVVEHVAGQTQLAWMGEPVSQYGDIVMEDAADSLDLMRSAWRFIVAELKPDVARLRKVRDDAAIAPLLADLGALSTMRQEAPYLDIAGKPFAEYEQRYAPRSRRNRRRLERRLAERGELTYERLQGGPEARRLAQVAIEMKRDWLKDRGLVSPALADPRMAAFFADVAEGANRPAGCFVSHLTSGGEPAALEVTLKCKDRTAMHIIVFNLKYEKVGAGVLLLEKSIAHTCGNGIRTFDLLAPADSYKVDWADGVVAVNDWSVALSLKGRIYAHLYLGLVRPAIKAVLARLPMRMRRAVAGRYVG
jgi:CelD/BcsL family acetyltransferase involved in cellulose biosynthesis